MPIVWADEGVLEFRGVDIVKANHALASLIPDLVPSRAFTGGRAGMVGFSDSDAHEVRRGYPTRFRMFDWIKLFLLWLFGPARLPEGAKCRFNAEAGPLSKMGRGPPTMAVCIEPKSDPK